MLFDTTFLIDLQREIRKGKPGKAAAFLENNANQKVKISLITWGEFAEGFNADDLRKCKVLLKPCEVIPLSEAIAWRFGRISSSLRRQGVGIGDNDVWIAATALEHGEYLVTRNLEHFKRVKGLKLLPY